MTTNGEKQLRPTVAFNERHGEFLVVWEEGEDNADILAQRVSSSGELCGGTIAICTAPLKQLCPALAYNSRHDEYLVVWQDGTGEPTASGHNYIPGRRLSWDGQPLGSKLTIGDQTSCQLMPDAAYNSSNDQYLVVWHDGVVDVRGQLLSGEGELVGSSLTICAAPRQQYHPAVTHNPHRNEYVVLWDDHRPNSHYDIYGCRLSSSGVVLTEFPICALPGDQRRPSIAFSSSGKAYLAVWSDYSSDPLLPRFSAQRVSEEGALEGGLIALSVPTLSRGAYSSRSAAIIERAAIAFDPRADQYVVAWPEGGGPDIRCTPSPAHLSLAQ